jgi:uroporphyrinogen-III synthase
MTQIENRAGQAILCPAIDVIEVPTKSMSLATVHDAIIFVSPTSVEMGWKKVEGLIETSENILIAAVGIATGRKVLDEGFKALFPDGQGGARALIELLRGQLDLSTSRLLVINGEGGDGDLEELLKLEGAEVHTFACYRRIDIRDASQPERLGASIDGFDAWVATSRRSIDNILAQFKGQRIKLKAIPLFVNHSAIADEALAKGVTTVFVCQDAGRAMIQNLESWFMSMKLKE